MSLKECLQERIEENTLFPDCKTVRTVLFVWDKNDKMAADFCERLQSLANGDAMAICADGSEDASVKLNSALERCREKMQLFEISCSKGFYILAVGTSPALMSKLQIPAQGVLEFVRVTDSSTWEKIPEGNPNDFYKEWRIRSSDISAAAVLLFHAAYQEKLLSTDISVSGGARVCGLKFRNYSAVSGEMSRHYLSVLENKISESKYNMSGVNKKLQIEQQIRQVLELCIQPDWIPFTGYEILREELEEQYSRSFFQRVFLRNSIVRTNWTIREVLCVLQGEEDNQPQPEWVRRRLLEVELPELCEKVMKENRELLKNSLERHFSYYDMCYSLAGNLEKYSQKKRDDIGVTEKRLEEILERTFSSRSLEFPEILKGLRDYYQEWKQYVECCTESLYWSYIADFVKEEMPEYRKKYQELRTARNVLEAFALPLQNTEQAYGREGSEICSRRELEEEIRHYVSHREFEIEEVFQLLESADNFYQNSDDNHVDTKRRPRICLLFSRELEIRREECRNTAFRWELLPVDYLPKSLLWELRIYTHLAPDSDTEK